LTLLPSVQVVSDVIVLICISISFAFGKSACQGKPFNSEAVGVVVAMIVISLILGGLLGERIRETTPLLQHKRTLDSDAKLLSCLENLNLLSSS